MTSGNVYNPEEDPCLECECDNGKQGRCTMVACDTPTCKRYVMSRDVCCNYTCMPEGLTGDRLVLVNIPDISVQ